MEHTDGFWKAVLPHSQQSADNFWAVELPMSLLWCPSDDFTKGSGFDQRAMGQEWMDAWIRGKVNGFCTEVK